MDRIREQSTQQAALESKEADARIMAESVAAAQVCGCVCVCLCVCVCVCVCGGGFVCLCV